MADSFDLNKQLLGMDGGSYGALKNLVGSYSLNGFELSIDRVQSDPYAPPSRMQLKVPLAATKIPAAYAQDPDCNLATCDFIARDIFDAIRQGPREFGFVEPGQEILERTSVVITQEHVLVRFTFQFPAAGRRVKGRRAAQLLVEELPMLVKYSALGQELDSPALNEHVETYRNYLSIRQQLSPKNLVAFVADHALLARSSGATDTPLLKAVAFSSPASYRTTLHLADGTPISGMGIPQGITLIVGGGFHGKSTLLQALERGVYPHVPGDGRELVVVEPSAVAVRAEDGRAVHGTDISPFIGQLPGGKQTRNFTTENASGSTSQAANTVEALEVGARLLLIDEDTSATNFMIRDADMAALIAAEDEPITPLVSRVRALYHELHVSTILVMGGSGAFLSQADHVIAMRNYLPHDVTARAHEIAGQVSSESDNRVLHEFARCLLGRKLAASRLLPADARKAPRARGKEAIQLGGQNLDLRYLSQLTDTGQTEAIALLIPHIARFVQEGKPLVEAVRNAYTSVQEQGLDSLTGGHYSRRARGDLALPRVSEVFAAVNRVRA